MNSTFVIPHSRAASCTRLFKIEGNMSTTEDAGDNVVLLAVNTP